MQYFDYAHLRPHLQAVSKPFHDLAWIVYNLVGQGGDPDEVDKSLEALLVAKDAAVRAALELGTESTGEEGTEAQGAEEASVDTP